MVLPLKMAKIPHKIKQPKADRILPQALGNRHLWVLNGAGRAVTCLKDDLALIEDSRGCNSTFLLEKNEPIGGGHKSAFCSPMLTSPLSNCRSVSSSSNLQLGFPNSQV